MTGIKYFRTLDWLRAFAILSVLFSHWSSTFLWKEHPYYNWLSSVNDFIVDVLQVPATMHPGVIIFIVLSGFVIHYPNAIRKFENSEYIISIESFIKRRFVRIYPALAVIILIGAFSAFVLKQQSVDEILINSLASFFLVYALFNVPEPFFNPHLVTVMVELVLYLQYLLIYRVFKLGMNGLVVVAVVSIPISLLFEHDSHRAWHNLVSFTPYWVIGACAAHLVVFKNDYIVKHIDFSLFWLLFLFYVLIKNLYLGANQYIDKFGLIYFGVIVGVLMINLVKNDYLNSMAVISSSISKTLIFIAAISYSMYLIHWPLMNSLNMVISTNNIGMTPTVHLLMLATIVCSSYVYYKFIEKPSHMKARRL